MLVIAVGFVVTVMTSKQKELVTKKRQFEELAESERKFRNLFEHSPAGMLRITTPHWNVVDANHALLTMFQVTTLEEVKEIIYSISPPERKRLVSLLLEKGTVEDYETIIHRHDGSALWISFSASLSSRENHTEAVIIDITARRKAEETIHEQAKLLDQAQDAIVVLDLQKRVQYWNKGAERLYGYPKEAVSDKNVMEFIYDDHTAKDFRDAYELTMQNGEWSGELHQIAHGGAVLISDCRWTLVRNSKSEPTGILQVCTDVTERKRMESRFLRAQRVESIGIFASGIVHDLNNVFSPMLIGVRVLKRKLHDQRSRKLIQNIESSARYGSEMAQQVLSFVKGAQGIHTKLNPQRIIKDVYRQLEQILPDNVHVQIHTSEPISSVQGDVTQLHQVLVNLCTNARDAMPQGGDLWVSAENTQVNKEMVEEYAGAAEGDYVVFSVRDTGTGIPASEVHKIFEPFYTTKEVGKGTGLGLSITIGIIKGHKGFITVESEKGKGSTFKIYLPAVTTVSSNPDDMAYPSDDHQTIIYIARSEDEYTYKLFDDLEDHGYEPLLAVGTKQIQESLLQNRNTLLAIIFDGTFPRENRELMKEVLKLEPFPKLIVLATNDQMEEMKGDEELHLCTVVELPAESEGIIEILRKPLVRESTTP